ncbi:hypothetical protein PsYK624_066540 [Phanerochaete sordida]|uniref:C3H1-type domain-containing protein n=1 Tax=Phanerochaete sordida TaxID=48140 RepID=A0A9P3GAW0_9APHY|nr:hypothetical protein PsYK624_066540 [Phanerochaete sordida]
MDSSSREKAVEKAAKRAAVLEGKKKRAEEAKSSRSRCGNNYFKEQRYADAAECYEEAVTTYGPRVPYLNNLAATYLKLKRYLEAALCAEDVLGRDPKQHKARFRRAMARKGQGQIEESISDLTVLLRHDPACTEAKQELELLRATAHDDDSYATYASPKDLAAPLPDDTPPDGDCDTPWLSESSDFEHTGSGVPCRFYNHGLCTRGTACTFSHAPDARSVRDTRGRNVCLYHLLGFCTFGDAQCVYAHDAAQLPRGPWSARAWRTHWRGLLPLSGAHKDARMLERLAPMITAPWPTARAELLPLGRYRKIERNAGGAGRAKGKGRARDVFGGDGCDGDDEFGEDYGDGDEHDDGCDDDEYDGDGYDDDAWSPEFEAELDERAGNMGFTNAQMWELAAQGVKPWDDDAWEVMHALNSM